MADERMSPSAVAPGNVIHHASRFGYSEPTTCGRTEVPKPASSEWRYVTCSACLAKAPVVVGVDEGVGRDQGAAVAIERGPGGAVRIVGARFSKTAAQERLMSEVARQRDGITRVLVVDRTARTTGSTDRTGARSSTPRRINASCPPPQPPTRRPL